MSSSSTPFSLKDFQTAIKARDADKIRNYLHNVLNPASSNDDVVLSDDKLLKTVGNEMIQSQDLIDILADVLWFESHNTTTTTNDNDPKGKEEASSSTTPPSTIIQFLKILHDDFDHHDNKQLLQKRLIENVNGEILEKSGWIGAEKDLSKRLRLFNTQSYYKQHKFNLFVEESQGYAKYLQLLISMLVSDNKNTNPVSNEIRQQQIQTIIGKFSLDPNRCLDLIIDVMMNHNTNKGGENNYYNVFLPLLKVLPLEHLPELLMLALQRNAKEKQNNNKLYTIMSWLVQHQILKVDKMLIDYMFLEKIEQLVKDAYEAMVHAQREAIKDMTRTKLGGGGGPSSTANTEIDIANNKALELRKELSQTYFVQWICKLLQDKVSYSDVLPTLSFEQWSQLCVLFPETIGVALCDIVLMIVVEKENEEETAADGQSPGNNNKNTVVPWNTKKVTAAVKAAKQEEDKGGAAKMEVDDDEQEEESQGQDQANNDALEDLVLKINKILEYTRESGCISLRPLLYTKLCRTFAARLHDDEHPSAAAAPPVAVAVINFFKTFMIPSLSLFSANPVLIQEVWAFVKQLPYQIRYGCYDYWRGGGLERAAIRTDKPLWLVKGEIQAGKDTRYALKRLSKDTIRDMSRAIAKVCHSHPLVVFTTILNQIESYDNLVSVMVDALRFVTPLSLDVLSSCILSRLSGDSASGMMVNRSRLKEDGVNVSQWLQSLEAFVGAFYKRFPGIDFRGILNYLIQRLKGGHVMELGVLKSLLKTSAGWGYQDYSPAASLSTTQLEGRAGSNLLRRETMSFGIVQEIDWKASDEVRRVLQSDNMGVSLLVLLAQVRHQIVFASSSSKKPPPPVKLVANLVDNCQVVMSILLDFLTDPSSSANASNNALQKQQAIAVYAASLPSMPELFTGYRLDVPSCWMLCRPLIRAAAASTAKLESGETKAEGSANDPLEGYKSSEASLKLYKGMLPERTWSFISVELFEVFYSHNLYDIFCPEGVYTTEISRIDKLVLAARTTTPPPSSLGGNMPGGPGAPPNRNDEEEQKRLKSVTSRLSNNLEKQKKHVLKIRQLIASKKDLYFPSDVVSQESAAAFLSCCLYPRCMQCPEDALYCAHFISILHEEGTPGFSTLHLFDSLIVSLSRALFGMTEGEAANASILLYEIWNIVSEWRYDEDAYKEGAAGKPGSYMIPEGASAAATASSSGDNDNKNSDGDGEGNKEPTAVSYKDYEDLYNKWHAAIGAAAIGALQSPEYIHTRNCLIILTRLVECFPTRPILANKLLKTLEPIQDESNELADIRASAQAYGMQLQRARDDGVWKEESEATVLARQKRDQAAAAARQKQAEKQMEEIRLESEKITDKIGVWDGGRPGGGRDRGRGGPSGNRAPPPPAALDKRGGGPPPPPARGGDDDRWARDRAPPKATTALSAGTYSSMGSSSGGGGGGGDGGRPSGGGRLDDPWQKQQPSRLGKRSRASSPVEEGEAIAGGNARDDIPQRPAKRNRPEPPPEPRYEDGGGGGGGGGGRRDGGGGRRRRTGGGRR